MTLGFELDLRVIEYSLFAADVGNARPDLMIMTLDRAVTVNTWCCYAMFFYFRFNDETTDQVILPSGITINFLPDLGQGLTINRPDSAIRPRSRSIPVRVKMHLYRSRRKLLP